MAQTNSRRVSHQLEDQPNVFRDDQLQQAINDLSEEDTGVGYAECVYNGVFLMQMNNYSDTSKTKKRSVINFTYSPLPFVSSIVKILYDEETGLIEVARTTVAVTYNANKTVNSINTVNTGTP